MIFLEEERAVAVTMHLDSLARKPVHTPTPPAAVKPTPSSGGTDQALHGGYSTQQTQPPITDSQVHVGSSGQSVTRAGDTATAWITVKTLKDAMDVCTKQKTNLEGKKINKCPLCQKQYTFDKTWSQVSPPVKTAMVSTQLASCPLFAKLTSEQNITKVAAHMACPLCMSWEHTKHKMPGGREVVDPKCKVLVSGVECGGRYGRWFHPTGTSEGTTGNLVTVPSADHSNGQRPGLYEVYSAGFREERLPGKRSSGHHDEMQQLSCFEDDQNLERVDNEQAQIVSAWRDKWISQVFPDLVPHQKWKQQHRDLEEGDIGLVKYEKKLGPDAWHLARIASVVPSEDGRVRTIHVEFRPRHMKDQGQPYKSKVPLKIEIGVQRFAVMLPRSEQEACVQQQPRTRMPQSPVRSAMT